ALEVQRMTLSTLKNMNVQMEDLREAMKIKLPTPASKGGTAPAAPAPAPTQAHAAQRSATAEEAGKPARKAAAKKKPGASTASPGVVDPMQWWGALTKQFTELATNALNDGTADVAKNLASAMVKQSFDAAEQTLKAVTTPPRAAKAPARPAPEQKRPETPPPPDNK
ncbi:MAG TPA: hypothetical protein VFP68_01240, partial [Burkholderiaceae bacterium]|nr:hypothetical protein [Burkholderiaceae bacterium]